MAFRFDKFVGISFIIILLILNLSHSTLSSLSHYNTASEQQQSTDNYWDNNLISVECPKAAVWRCGHVFIKAHKFLNYIGNKESFHPKCSLRSAFFACLKNSKNKSCHKHKSSHTQKFQKRLADTLWSTRACLLGYKATEKQIIY